jgi:hypothetical protein
MVVRQFLPFLVVFVPRLLGSTETPSPNSEMTREDVTKITAVYRSPIGVTQRIDTVALHIHGKRIFARGPGLDYYPYPYCDAERNTR